MQSETPIMVAIREAVNRDGRVRLFRNSVGTGLSMDAARVITYGLSNGSPDLVGWLKGSGRFVAIEVKTPIGTAQDNQKAWRAMAVRDGVAHAFCRSPKEALAFIDSISH